MRDLTFWNAERSDYFERLRLWFRPKVRIGLIRIY
jgi:hypothetical protein